MNEDVPSRAGTAFAISCIVWWPPALYLATRDRDVGILTLVGIATVLTVLVVVSTDRLQKWLERPRK